MKLVIDANAVISALIADSKTRELIVTLEPELLTPTFVHDEIENSEDRIVGKSGMEQQRVQQFIGLVFQYIEVVFPEVFHPYIEKAEAGIGETDPDDVLYVACALAIDADIWSDDSDFDERRTRLVRHALGKLPSPTPSALRTSVLEGRALMWTPGNQSPAIGW